MLTDGGWIASGLNRNAMNFRKVYWLLAPHARRVVVEAIHQPTNPQLQVMGLLVPCGQACLQLLDLTLQSI